VNVFTAHVNVGFFQGAALPDPAHLLQGTGKFMRHVKLRPGTATNAAALGKLIDAAYWDIKEARRKRIAHNTPREPHSRRHFRLPPFAKYAKDGPCTRV
jgi:hypothetical protein